MSAVAGSVVFGAAMLSVTGLNSFQGLVGQFSGVLWVALMCSLDSPEDSLDLGVGLNGFIVMGGVVNGCISMVLRGDQPGGRLNLVNS